MEKIALGQCCEILDSMRVPITASERKPGPYPYYGANGIQDYVSDYIFDDELVLLAEDGGNFGSRTKPIAYRVSGKCWVNNHAHVLKPKLDINVDYLCYSLMFYDTGSLVNGATRQKLTQTAMKEMQIPLRSLDEQIRIVNRVKQVLSLVNSKTKQLNLFDDLIKARFVEMFGDLKANTNGWKVRSFLEFAKIDTVMIHDFSNYKHYPHIGIDSIEKDTGIIKGYRTVEEDGIVSGKYLFTDKHIIYSKIRPNLNKVAMPDFTGVCSADAYPILANENICNREFLTYVMRSNLFLDYILKFSSRTNLPKVNKEQVEGFACPIPSISIQKQFSSLVHQIDKSKFSKIA